MAVGVTNVQIPRDPRVDGIAFITEMPNIMDGRMDRDEWNGIISNLNEIFHESESPSFLSLIKTVLMIPFLLLGSKNIHTRVKEYLDGVNTDLRNHNIYIIHPGNNQYIELEVDICDE